MVEISGVWVLNDELNMYGYTFLSQAAENRYTEVNFTCAKKKYSAISWYHCETGTTTVEALSFREKRSAVENEYTYCVYQEGHASITLTGWQDESYKTIDFGATPQSVSKEFYDWFSANAVKQP